MNSKLNLIAFLLISTGVLTSCTMEKRLYSSGYHIEWMSANKGRKAQSLANKESDDILLDEEGHVTEVISKESIDLFLDREAGTFEDQMEAPAFVSIKSSFLDEKVKNDARYSFHEQELVSEQTISQISTRKTANRRMPTVRGEENTAARVEGLGLAGFIIGLVGWFVPLFGFVMCLLAIIFGAISIGKINRNPERFKGMGFAITSLVLGIIGVGIVLLFALL